MRKKRQISFKECYAILEISKGATLEEVKRAYRRRAFELHPDLNPGDPDAVRNFQQLNEAYVALSQVLQTEEAARGAAASAEEKRKEHARAAEKQRTTSTAGSAAGGSAAGQQRSTASGAASTGAGGAGSAGSAGSTAGTGAGSASGSASGQSASAQSGGAFGDQSTSGSTSGQSASDQGGGANTQGSSAQSRAASAAYGQEDVLRDLLNDPFARRVFEDIYSEVNRQSKPDEPQKKPESTPPPQPEPHKPVPKKVQMEWGQHRVNLDFSKGVGGVVKNWLRRQIDEEQTFVLPASSLRPGVRLRLQIRRGLSEELSTIEVTLPKDFVVGKPVRLRGLGKKVGAWQGDLYLTFKAK